MGESNKRLFQPHYSETTDLRVVQTRKALQKAFLELLSTSSLDKISIRQIVAAAGVGYNTFFRHYPNKEALLDAVIADEIAQVVDLSATALDASNSYEASKALFEYVDANRKVWKKLLSTSAIAALREAFIQHLTEVSSVRTKLRSKQTMSILINHVAAGTIEMLYGWYQQKPRMSVAEIAEMYDQLIASPVIENHAIKAVPGDNDND